MASKREVTRAKDNLRGFALVEFHSSSHSDQGTSIRFGPLSMRFKINTGGL